MSSPQSSITPAWYELTSPTERAAMPGPHPPGHPLAAARVAGNQDPAPRMYTQTPRGVPIRNGPALLRPSEIDLLIELYDVKSRTFDMAQEADRDEHDKLFTQMVNRRFVKLGNVLEQWNQTTNSYFIFVRWQEPYALLPPALLGRRVNAAADQGGVPDAGHTASDGVVPDSPSV